MHLWSIQTGQCVASYQAKNHMDEHVSAYCVDANPYMEKLYAGYNKCARVFDIHNPHKAIVQQSIHKSGHNKIEKTIVTAIATHAEAPFTYAFGCCNKTIYFSDLRSNKIHLKLEVSPLY